MSADTSARYASTPVQRSASPLRVSGPVLAVLLLVDVALVVASLLSGHPVGAPHPGIWVLERDGGMAEFVGYLHQLALVVLLVDLWRHTRRPVWLAWGSVYACALLDDGTRLHETQGDWFAEVLHLPDGVAGLRADDLGELVVWGLLAVVPLLAIAWLHLRSDAPTRRASLGLAALTAVYVFFGVVVDQLHAASLGGPWEGFLGTAEDGGELMALSLAVAYVVVLAGAARRHEPGADGADQAPARDSAAASSSPA